MNITKENAYPVGTKVIYPDGMIRTLRRILKFPDGSDFHEWELLTLPTPEKQETKTMVDSYKARIWLAETCASIKVIASELDGLTQDEKFKLVCSFGSRLWRDSEDFRVCT